MTVTDDLPISVHSSQSFRRDSSAAVQKGRFSVERRNYLQARLKCLGQYRHATPTTQDLVYHSVYWS